MTTSRVAPTLAVGDGWTASMQHRPARRFLDPVGHYNRPDVFRLHVDTSPHEAVVTERFAPERGEA